MKHPILLLQLAASAGIIAMVPGNILKAVTLVILWLVTFRTLSRAESIFYICTCSLFTLMNALALRQGVFYFTHPDLLGMPFYEFLMWGFYLLHTVRMLDGKVPKATLLVYVLATAFAMAFGVISNQQTLLMVTTAIIVLSFVFFHQRGDFLYFSYMVFVGAVIEYTGVLSGQWAYPGNPPGGVPLWFITLWGGVGLYLRRLALPLLFPIPATDE